MAPNDGDQGDGGKQPDKKPNGAADTPNISPEAQAEIDKFKKQAEDERAARLAAERRASEATSAAAQAGKTAEDAEFSLVTNAIDTANAVINDLKSKYATALSGQDYEAAADLQVEIGKATAKLQVLENGKASMEEERKRPKPEPQRRLSDGEMVEETAKALAPWPRSAAWIRAHPEFVTDEKRNARLQAAHHLSRSEGIVPDTDAYFEFIEKQLGLRGGDSSSAGAGGSGDGSALSAAGTGKARGGDGDRPPPAAPAGGGGGSGNARRLTESQKEIARACGMTEEQYAAQLEKIRSESTVH